MTEFFRKIRKPLAFLLAATLLSALCGCSLLYDEDELSEILQASDPTDTSAETKDDAFSLSYYTGEALDPFTSASRTNSELLHLCYSGLFAVDAGYGSVPVLAESYEADGNTLTVTLKENARFSDGTPVTARDCVASYDRAKQKDSVWKGNLSYIRSYEAVDDLTFRIVFRSYYPTQLNLLTVPIIRFGTDSAYPVGCGRYAVRKSEGLSLVKTECGILPGEYALQTIELVGVSDREALIYNFNYGKLQAVCADVSLGTEEYRSDSELVTVPTNRFTFLVVNRTRPELADVNFSKALTYLIDRQGLVSEANGLFADPVWAPLNPAWNVTAQAALNPNIQSDTIASEAFQAAGLTLEDGERVFNEEPVTLRVLVNRENSGRVKAAQFLVEELKRAGFSVELIQATWDEYQNKISALDYDLYLGEIHLPDNLDLSALYDADVCNSGLPPETYDALRELGISLLSGETEVQAFVSAFQELLPFIPLHYSRDALAVSMQVSGSFAGSASELYWGIEDWHFTQN